MPDKSVIEHPSMNPRGSVEASIASTLIPWSRDDERALYFGYRSSGLSVRETLHIIERSKPWLSLQRHDPKFVELEGRIPEFRKELSKEYIELEFFRNFRLVLEKDHQILLKSLQTDSPLSRFEHEYLLKLRTQYSPAQIQILEAVVSGEKGGFNFAEFVANNPDIIQLSRTDTITVAKGHREEDDGE